jgi:hypothetical protein
VYKLLISNNSKQTKMKTKVTITRETVEEVRHSLLLSRLIKDIDFERSWFNEKEGKEYTFLNNFELHDDMLTEGISSHFFKMLLLKYCNEHGLPCYLSSCNSLYFKQSVEVVQIEKGHNKKRWCLKYTTKEKKVTTEVIYED